MTQSFQQTETPLTDMYPRYAKIESRLSHDEALKRWSDTHATIVARRLLDMAVALYEADPSYYEGDNPLAFDYLYHNGPRRLHRFGKQRRADTRFAMDQSLIPILEEMTNSNTMTLMCQSVRVYALCPHAYMPDRYTDVYVRANFTTR